MTIKSDRPMHLVLVADGAKALFLRNSGQGGGYRLDIETVLENDNPPTREQGTDQPGRAISATGASGSPNAQSGMEQTDWHRLGKERFAASIAERLDADTKAGSLASLVIVASPLVLGTLRKAISKETAGLVRQEIAKDLTGMTVAEIEKALAA
ncbi:MAG TPA: host attachment family protein [Kaistia sp.]|nr:host attachment family protein [Kaistia sp.]